jgi:hypothetical protein
MISERSDVSRSRRVKLKLGRKLSFLLLTAIDETFRQVFREEGTKVIYGFVENKCHLKREQIAETPEVFCASLQRLLVSAAPVIEQMILKNLYSKYELKFVEKKGFRFSDYIQELKELRSC